MNFQMQILMGAGAAASLSLARMYIAGQSGMSPYCLAGGAAVAFAPSLVASLPDDILDYMEYVPGTAADFLTGAFGAVAFEFAVGRGLQINDFTSRQGLVRMAIGAAAALLGSKAAQMAGLVIGGKGK